jgi:hypothetical protein
MEERKPRMADSKFHLMSDDEELEKYSELFEDRPEPEDYFRGLKTQREEIKKEIGDDDALDTEKVDAAIWNKLCDKQE